MKSILGSALFALALCVTMPGVAQAADGGIQAHVEIDDRAIVPKAAAQVLARHEFTRPLHQGDQNFHRLLSQPDRDSVLAQPAGVGIHFEGPESHKHQ